MNLWIRSQQKEGLVKVNDKIRLSYNMGVDDTTYFIECDGTKVAVYNTRERALEILDKIQNHIAYLDQMIASGRAEELDLQQDLIFEMPKE